jgi:tetrahydromethanopterin S-methyltransferase subunit A
MAQNYNLDSDSDEEEVEAVAAISGSSTWHLHDIEKVFVDVHVPCNLLLLIQIPISLRICS